LGKQTKITNVTHTYTSLQSWSWTSVYCRICYSSFKCAPICNRC